MTILITVSPLDNIAPTYSQSIGTFKEYTAAVVFSCIVVGLTISFVKSLRG